MEIEKAKTLSRDSLRSMYKEYLLQKGINPSTTSTTVSDTFYLWNNGGYDLFWNVVTATEFDAAAAKELRNALTSNSSGNVDGLVVGYVATLRKFKDFIYDAPEPDCQEDYEALKAFLVEKRYILWDYQRLNLCVECSAQNSCGWMHISQN